MTYASLQSLSRWTITVCSIKIFIYSVKVLYVDQRVEAN